MFGISTSLIKGGPPECVQTLPCDLSMVGQMTSWLKSMLAHGSGRGSSCCGSTLVLVVDVVKIHSRRDKALEGLTYLVRSIKAVCVIQVCHYHFMLGSIGKGRFEGHGEETEGVPMCDTASGGLGSRPDTSNSDLQVKNWPNYMWRSGK